MNDAAVSKIQSLPPPYCYYAYAVSQDGIVDYMHYGYWETATKTIVEAQENLADLMKSHIPFDIGRILDSGCGLGRTTWDLADKGFDIVGISPDRSLILEAQQKYPQIADRFICSSFERYEVTTKFDLIFFQESSQYIDVKRLFQKCAALLQLRGFVLICDEVRYSHKPRLFNRKDDMLSFASINGFDLVCNEVITSNVLRTRKFFTEFLRDNIEDIVRLFSVTGRNVKAEVLDLAGAWDRDTQLFESHDCGYEIFLFKKVSSSRITVAGCLFGAQYLLKRQLRNSVNRWRKRT
ncbi:MAG: class I SAM-dependent methyltransferase [Proteobacteria bacterium]|nr:class I SAM-dependent methyltransferase [Pseudomonadota bacterium]